MVPHKQVLNHFGLVLQADDSRQTLVQKQMMPPANLDAECDSQVVVLSQQIRTLEAANKVMQLQKLVPHVAAPTCNVRL